LNRKPAIDDWRRQGQERYLSGKRLVFRAYQSSNPHSDHDHCEFCGKKFMQRADCLEEGYSTEDGYRWICANCFGDFQGEFGWTIANAVR
jgi:hypothetical protein